MPGGTSPKEREIIPLVISGRRRIAHGRNTKRKDSAGGGGRGIARDRHRGLRCAIGEPAADRSREHSRSSGHHFPAEAVERAAGDDGEAPAYLPGDASVR